MNTTRWGRKPRFRSTRLLYIASVLALATASATMSVTMTRVQQQVDTAADLTAQVTAHDGATRASKDRQERTGVAVAELRSLARDIEADLTSGEGFLK